MWRRVLSGFVGLALMCAGLAGVAWAQADERELCRAGYETERGFCEAVRIG